MKVTLEKLDKQLEKAKKEMAKYGVMLEEFKDSGDCKHTRKRYEDDWESRSTYVHCETCNEYLGISK